VVRTHVDHVCVHRVRVRVRNVFMHVFFLLFCAYPVFTGVALFVRLGGSKGSSQVLKRTNVLYTVTLYRNYWRGREGACVRACVRACMHACVDGGMQRGRQRARARYDESKKATKTSAPERPEGESGRESE